MPLFPLMLESSFDKQIGIKDNIIIAAMRKRRNPRQNDLLTKKNNRKKKLRMNISNKKLIQI